MIVTRPGDDGRTVRAFAVRETDPTLLRNVQLATQTPEIAVEEILRVVLRGDRDVTDLLLFPLTSRGVGEVLWIGIWQLRSGINHVFLPLQIPSPFPGSAFDQAARFVAEHGEQRDRLDGDQFGDQGLNIERRIVTVQFAHLLELRVPPRHVGQLGDRIQRNLTQRRIGVKRFRFLVSVGPFALGRQIFHPPIKIKIALEPVEQPFPEGTFKLRFPRLGIPAAFVFGLFDQPDVRVAFDKGDPAFDELTVVVGPLGGEFGDRRRAVAVKPGRLHFPRCHLPSEDNLECPLAKF